MVRDIRELTDSPEAYAAELRRRWGGLLSYRYIGRSYAAMDLGPVDNTVTIRRDMRDPTGGLLLAVLGIASPEGGHMSDLEAVPNPVIHSCQILDPGRDVRRIEMVSEELKRGRQMGYSRAKIVDADRARPRAGLDPGAGHQHRHAARGPRTDGGQPARGGRLRRPASAVAGVRRPPSSGRPLGLAGARGRGRLAGRRAAHRTAVRHPRDSRRRCGCKLAGTDHIQGVSSHVMFLARGKAGPFRVEIEPMLGADGRSLFARSCTTKGLTTA